MNDMRAMCERCVSVCVSVCESDVRAMCECMCERCVSVCVSVRYSGMEPFFSQIQK